MAKPSTALFFAFGAITAFALAYFALSLIGWSTSQSAVTAGIVVVSIGVCTAVYSELQRFRVSAEGTDKKHRERLERVMRMAGLFAWEIDLKTNEVTYSDDISQLFGHPEASDISPEDYISKFVHPDDQKTAWEPIMESPDDVDVMESEYRVITADGEIRLLRAEARKERDADGTPVRTIGTTQDITAQREAEHRLRSHSAIIQETASAVIITAPDGTIHDVNPATTRLTGFARTELNGLNMYEVLDWENLEGISAQDMEESLRNDGYWQAEHTIFHRDGTATPVETSVRTITDENDKTVERVTTIRDISERKQAEETLRGSERRLAKAQELAQVGSWELNLNTDELFWSDEFYRILGIDPRIGIASSDDFYKYVHPADADALRQSMSNLIETGTPIDIEYRVRTEQGTEKTVHGYAEISHEEAGKPIIIGGTLQDISAQHETERKLAQAMKMETVGQLSAGVAHDFNNLLAVMMGNIELIQMRVEGQMRDEDQAELMELADKALEAGASGADLVKRLLAYSRRQMLFPERTQIDGLVGGVVALLRRTLAQNIEINFEANDDLWDVEVDAAQLESGLMNLAVNARDAMPDGGRLSITAHNVSGLEAVPGASERGARNQYVCIDVTDTGMGMPQDVIDKAIEPFFTTKEVGEGTGLGLSMVYGFVRQSGGIFNITSQEGAGTTVRLFLPRMLPGKAELTLIEPADPVPDRGAVLIVEDDKSVINVVALQIRELGYRPFEAGTVDEALVILKDNPDIQLLLTDVILGPGVNGVELALKALELRPRLGVLCMSGFVEPEKFGEYAGTSTLPFIAKPFTTAKLDDRLRETLEAPEDKSSLPRKP